MNKKKVKKSGPDPMALHVPRLEALNRRDLLLFHEARGRFERRKAAIRHEKATAVKADTSKKPALTAHHKHDKPKEGKPKDGKAKRRLHAEAAHERAEANPSPSPSQLPARPRHDPRHSPRWQTSQRRANRL